MSRWGCSVIHTGDFLSLNVSGFKKAISKLMTEPGGSTRGGTVQGADGWKNKYSIDICLYLNDEKMPVVDYTVRADNGAKKEGQIQFEKTPCRFGGFRYYFVCPITHNRCTVLRLFRGDFVSLDGIRQLTNLDIPYTCQTISGFDRVRRQVNLSKRRAKRCGIDVDNEHFYQKPKWMRWRTFSRLIGDIEESEAREDYWILTHWGRRLGLNVGIEVGHKS